MVAAKRNPDRKIHRSDQHGTASDEAERPEQIQSLVVMEEQSAQDTEQHQENEVIEPGFPAEGQQDQANNKGPAEDHGPNFRFRKQMIQTEQVDLGVGDQQVIDGTGTVGPGIVE